jgi:methylthioribose-1-phosphate isomerase
MISIEFRNNRLFYLDQRELPLKEKWRQCKTLEQGYAAIKGLSVRGAPLIGVFAAYVIAIHLKALPQKKYDFLKKLKQSIDYLKSCRPTAINLSWALGRLEAVCLEKECRSLLEIKKALLKEARLIHQEDVLLCRNMARFGVKLIKKGDRILTHCNTGFLAASGQGTALSVIYEAKHQKKDITVYVDETRPLLQGARLTSWELTKSKIPVFVICDNMAAYLMQKGMIDKVFLGADRIAANGDVANKIGTYSVAIAAHYHKIPFYVVAPFSTFDMSLSLGKDIPIEERSEDEVSNILGKVQIAPKGVKVHNFAFDVTPNELVTAIVSDKGIVYPPYEKNISRVLHR